MASGVICIVIPLKLVSVANLREHWAKRASRAKQHRLLAWANLRGHSAPRVGKVAVTLTRIAPRPLDSDNLSSSFKATRDGVADWLGVDDGSDLVTWNYAQRKGKPKEYAAEIVVEFGVEA